MTLKPTANPPHTYPADLFAQPIGGDRPWWVARTKSRQEKSLAWDFKTRAIDYYLPLVSRPQKNRKRMRTSIVPLFSGYLFFRGTESERCEAVRTGRLAQVIPVADQERLQRELAALAQVTAGQFNLELCDFMRGGQCVRIITGPLAGLEGIVTERKNRRRIILQIEAIKQASAVEIGVDQVQPI